MAGVKVRVELQNDKELMAKLRRLSDHTKEVLEAAVTAGAEVMRDDARPKAPGPEIEMETVQRRKTRVVKDIGPIREKWYYRFFEYGTAAGVRTTKKKPFTFRTPDGRLIRTRSINHPGMAAKPFLRPAFDQNSGENGEAVQRVRRKFKEAIDAIS